MTTLYAATMSLDGYIAGPGGDMSWLTPHLSDMGATADGLMNQIGCLLVGGRTCRGDDPNKGTEAEGAFSGRYGGPAVVLTRGTADPVPGVEFRSDVREAVARATELANGRYANILGAETARSCLEAGLLDEVLMFVAPVMLGDGVRVFERPGGKPVLLERRREVVDALWYFVRT